MAPVPKISRIEEYAMIGDCRTAALVSSNGSIDWLCLPRFDSPACFSALLGDADHGRWQIKPKARASVTRAYVDGSLILRTVFKTRGGTVSVTDFMPINQKHSSVVRLLEGIAGRVVMSMDMAIRFDYGMTVPWVSKEGKNTFRAIAGPDMLTLRTPAPMHGKGMRSVAEFTIAAGETIPFVLTNSRSYGPMPPPLNIRKALAETARFWRDWSARCNDAGPYTNTVRRSLIILKGLIFEPTGGIVAAPTTSLPEQIGGTRNWDYRYCWVRDASFTLLAFMNAGYYDEAKAWRDWLLRAVAGSPEQLQIMYGLAGERRMPEIEIPWLPGYKKSAPVRIGNAAAGQSQLDVYGELIGALILAVRGGIPSSVRGRASSALLLRKLEEIWCLPDNGIWEIRGKVRHFTHSKVMAWVAFNRAGTATQLGDEKLRQHYRHLADKIHNDVCTHGVHPKGNYFTQSYGSTEVDASLLLLPIVGFLPSDDERIKNTVERIEQTLMPEGLVIRYRQAPHVDGISGTEGAFLACSFWLVDNLMMLGRLTEAKKLFAKVASLANDVGLLSEEYDPHGKRMLGNFPQAFSHVALVNTAIGLHHAEQLASEETIAPRQRSRAQDTMYRHAISSPKALGR